MKIMEPKFVDREIEIAKLLELSKQSSTLPIYVYGPEGCGKTRLFKEFIGMFDGVGVYIDALERSELDKALFLSPYIKDCSSLIAEIVANLTGNIGRILADKIASILTRIASRYKLKNSRIVLVVDDIAHAIGVEKIEWYIKWLYELEWKTIREHEPEAIVFIATTSEGQSLSEVMRHTYTDVKLVWNLNGESAKKLLLELGISIEKKQEEIWRLTGGNPRAIIEIVRDYEGDISAWKEKILNIRITPMLKQVREKGLIKHLVKAVETQNNITETLEQILVQHNLIIYKAPRTLTDSKIEENLELGIGKYYAWQIPAYREVLKEVLQI